MIKKAQIKFIIIIMSLMFVMFGTVFISSCYILKSSTEKNIARTLEEIQSTYTLTNGMTISNSFVAEIRITGTTQFDASIVYTTNSSTNLTPLEMNEVVRIATKDTLKVSGIVNNTIYYKVAYYRNRYIISATNAAEMLENYRMSVLSVGGLTLTIYLILFGIVFLLSFSVFKPIKESFVKQKQFVSNASHELKTPITIISANSDVLKQNGNNEWLENIDSQTERLSLLVSDMLALAKMDENSIILDKQHLDLSEVVTNEALAFDALAFEKGKTFNIEVQPNITYYGDEKSIKNIVNILLDNAIKHANTGGTITLTLKNEHSKNILTVENTGSKIKDDEAEKIFERFYRGDSSRSRESGGSGLGLSIARGIADNNKWKISAKSKYENSIAITVIM